MRKNNQSLVKSKEIGLISCFTQLFGVDNAS